MSNSDLVGFWDVALSDGRHHIEFEHGTTTGKRVIRVDGREVHREDWMFKLVGRESFTVHNAKCEVVIEAVTGFAYEYSLEVNGKPLKKFRENQSKIMKTWIFTAAGSLVRVVLEKDTLDVWVSGKKVDTTGEFVDDGSETHFAIGPHNCYIKAVSSGKRREGIIHTLIVDDREIPEATE